MVRFTMARRVFPIVALSIAAVTAPGCDVVPAPAARVAEVNANPDPSRYSCYFADGSTADKLVAGQKLHWCGPAPGGSIELIRWSHPSVIRTAVS